MVLIGSGTLDDNGVSSERLRLLVISSSIVPVISGVISCGTLSLPFSSSVVRLVGSASTPGAIDRTQFNNIIMQICNLYFTILIRAHNFLCIHTYTHTHTYTYIYTCMHIYIHIHTYITIFHTATLKLSVGYRFIPSGCITSERWSMKDTIPIIPETRRREKLLKSGRSIGGDGGYRSPLRS